MKISLTLPDEIAHRFLALIPSRQRSAIVARLLEQELRQREQDLEAACLAANADVALAAEIEEWQEFDDDLEESPNSLRTKIEAVTPATLQTVEEAFARILALS